MERREEPEEAVQFPAVEMHEEKSAGMQAEIRVEIRVEIRAEEIQVMRDLRNRRGMAWT